MTNAKILKITESQFKEILNKSLDESMWEPSDSDEITLELNKKPTTVYLLLHDKNDGKYAEMLLFYRYDTKMFHVGSVEGEHGYGAALYEIAMTYMYPEYIAPSPVSVSEDARYVWKKYYEREDVDMVDMSGFYNKEFVNPSFGNKISENDDEFLMMKYRVYNPKYESLINKSDETWEQKEVE